MFMRTRARMSRYLPAEALASARRLPGILDEATQLPGTGWIRCVGELRPLQHRCAGCLEAVGLRVEVAQPPPAAAERIGARADLVGLNSERMRERCDLLGRAAAHR